MKLNLLILIQVFPVLCKKILLLVKKLSKTNLNIKKAASVVQ